MNTESSPQEKLHLAIEQALEEEGIASNGEILTGWVVAYELMNLSPEKDSQCGHFYGPREMTTWRVLGLIEWIRRFCLGAGDDGEGDGDSGDS